MLQAFFCRGLTTAVVGMAISLLAATSACAQSHSYSAHRSRGHNYLNHKARGHNYAGHQSRGHQLGSHRFGAHDLGQHRLQDNAAAVASSAGPTVPEMSGDSLLPGLAGSTTDLLKGILGGSGLSLPGGDSLPGLGGTLPDLGDLPGIGGGGQPGDLPGGPPGGGGGLPGGLPGGP